MVTTTTTSKMTKNILFLFCLILFLGCSATLQKSGQHYQKYNDFNHLNRVVELMPKNADTAFVKSILGEPIDMGFDYRYLIDSVGPNGCVIGAVFHIGEDGKIDQKWVGEICE